MIQMCFECSMFFLLDRLKEKLAVTCYLSLATENQAWQYRPVRLILDWGWGEMAVRRVGHDTYGFSGYICLDTHASLGLFGLYYLHMSTWVLHEKCILNDTSLDLEELRLTEVSCLDSCFCKSFPILAQHHIRNCNFSTLNSWWPQSTWLSWSHAEFKFVLLFCS